MASKNVVTVELTPRDRQRLESFARERGLAMSWIIRGALKRFLDKQEIVIRQEGRR